MINPKTTILKLSKTILILVLTLSAISCEFIDELPEANSIADETPPTAFFTFTSGQLQDNFTQVAFANQSDNATTYVWDFGDGTTSTEFDPAHEYAGEGMFTVMLTASDDLEQTSTFSQSVLIEEPEEPIGVTPTFDAMIQNADMQTYPTSENNNNDLVDAWTVDPDNSFNNGSSSTFNFWRNDDLEAWVSNPSNNGGSGTTDKPSSSGTDAMSAGGTSGRSLKFDSSGERAYQPFEVETGVLGYSISVFVRSETTPVGQLEGTFYILSSEPSSDENLDTIALAREDVISDGVDTWQQIAFDFDAISTFNFSQSRVDENADDILTSINQRFVILYFVPTNTVTSSNEVFLTDIVITTPQ